MTYGRWKPKKNAPDLNTAAANANCFGVSADCLRNQESNDLAPKESESLKAAADAINGILDHYRK